MDYNVDEYTQRNININYNCTEQQLLEVSLLNHVSNLNKDSDVQTSQSVTYIIQNNKINQKIEGNAAESIVENVNTDKSKNNLKENVINNNFNIKYFKII